MAPTKKPRDSNSAAAKRMRDIRERQKKLPAEDQEKLRMKNKEAVQRYRENLTKEKQDAIKAKDRENHQTKR